MGASTSIVIPCFNGWAYTHQLLMDIKRLCKDVDEILICDNASTDPDVANGVKFWKSLRVLPIRHVVRSENLGFLKNANLGLKEATGDVALLLSNDVRINSANFFPEVISLATDRTLVGHALYTHDTGWNKFDRVYPYLEGYFLAAKKSVWKELGYFDERYSPSDFEDVDLSTKALSLGYDLKKVSSTHLHHLGGRTYGYNAERLERTNLNKGKFEEKWVRKES